jgi:UDP-N-acetylglucosamine--N-acetylmuramyl-(pentapeptide) pyrophosphoryl-undecaprenol N-acetylglucosamine transferase
VYPLVAVAQALKRQDAQVQVKLMGDGVFVKRAAQDAGLPFTTITAPKLRRYTSAANVLDLFKVPAALIQSLWKLFWYMPDAVFAKGGYTSVFPVLVARLYLIPVYLHESDAVPGMGNTMLAKRAKLIFTSFEKSTAAFGDFATMLVGNPVRELGNPDKGASLKAFSLATDKATVLIIGGSQGATQINDVVVEGLVQLMQAGFQIIHQCGDANFEDVSKAVEQVITEGDASYGELIKAQYRAYPFLDAQQLATAYAACDIAVTRASANILTELATLGKPMIIVPLANAAQNHQAENAAEMTRYGGIVMSGVNVTPHLLLAQLKELLVPQRYEQVSASLKTFARPGAADNIAKTILNG